MEIKFLSVGCGDGICIRFPGEDGGCHNIFIDGGTEKGRKYEGTLRKEIDKLKGRGEKIDLWIITHIDDDHIGGILRFIKDGSLFSKADLASTRFWFNYSNIDYDTGLNNDNFKGVCQGGRLRDFLSKEALLEEFITDELQAINFHGIKLSVLSPNPQVLKKLWEKWKGGEIKIRQKEAASHKSAGASDHHIKVCDFNLTEQEWDTSLANASSISFILECSGKKFLFSADAHPRVLGMAIAKLGYSDKNKLRLEYMQVPHHGSKFNTDNSLLQMIDCHNYIISADGVKHNLPDKKTLARIIKHNGTNPVNFFITERNNVTQSIFSADGVMEKVALNFPPYSENGLIFNL